MIREALTIDLNGIVGAVKKKAEISYSKFSIHYSILINNLIIITSL